MKNTNIKPAQHSRGFLIWAGDTYFFRVYKGKEFTDYRICHSDLEIEILDPDSAFYSDEVLDHAPATLGIEVEQS